MAIYKIRNFRVEDRIESNHLPLCVEVEEQNMGRQGGRQEGKKRIIVRWDAEAVERYRNSTGDQEW